MTNTRLTFPSLNAAKDMFRKCRGTKLTEDDYAIAAKFDVAAEIAEAEKNRRQNNDCI